MFARLAHREITPEPITDAVGVGSTQSSPDYVLMSRKRCANRHMDGAAVAKVSHQWESSGDLIELKSATNLSTASRVPDTTLGVPQI
jgi:hypothetical protein